MTEHPILFSGPMVRAILEGRKTMTRRVIKPEPSAGVRWGFEGWEEGHGRAIRCPYGQPGDRLWVRETWGVGCRPDPREGWVDGIEYRADQAYIDEIEDLPLYPVELPDGVEIDDYVSKGWRPSIFMPRWASRILLEVTAVRVERVQDISEDDSEAEGLEGHNVPTGGDDYQDLWRDYSIKEEDNEGYNYFKNPRDDFHSIWDSINAKRGYGWDANPWVWVVEFKRIEP